MTSRRKVLALTVGLLPLAARAVRAQNTTPTPPPASAASQGKTPVAPGQASGPPIDKAQVGYQDVPYDGKVCAQCVYFIYQPMVGGAIESQCKMVAGPINPAGWCEIWAPKA